MRDTIFLPFQLLSTIAKLIRPGGNKTLIAENLSLKQQLIINSRSRQRAQNLTTRDRNILGVLPLFLHPRRLARSAIIKPSTLLSFQNALKKRKYRLLFSSRGGRKPGPKGQSEELNNAIVGMKQRNVPMSHPFVELLICSIRRGLLDQTFFWTATDLAKKFSEYQAYYNEHRCHSSRGGATPIEPGTGNVVHISNYRWAKHCRALFQLPVAA